jgi:hypothetical protein
VLQYAYTEQRVQVDLVFRGTGELFHFTLGLLPRVT